MTIDGILRSSGSDFVFKAIIYDNGIDLRIKDNVGLGPDRRITDGEKSMIYGRIASEVQYLYKGGKRFKKSPEDVFLYPWSMPIEEYNRHNSTGVVFTSQSFHDDFKGGL